jgi:hypothetical protein
VEYGRNLKPGLKGDNPTRRIPGDVAALRELDFRLSEDREVAEAAAQKRRDRE